MKNEDWSVLKRALQSLYIHFKVALFSLKYKGILYWKLLQTFTWIKRVDSEVKQSEYIENYLLKIHTSGKSEKLLS